MKKENKLVLFFTIMFLSVGIIIGIILENNKNYDVYYPVDKIYFQYNGYEYKMKLLKKYIYVTKSEVVMCIKAPCNPIKVDDYKVYYNDDIIKKLDEYFEKYDFNDIYSDNIYETDIAYIDILRHIIGV